jgi:hypothetical protein
VVCILFGVRLLSFLICVDLAGPRGAVPGYRRCDKRRRADLRGRCLRTAVRQFPLALQLCESHTA